MPQSSCSLCLPFCCSAPSCEYEPVIFTIRFPLAADSMSEGDSSGDIVESPLSQNAYVLIWTVASLVSFIIFVVYF